jgi:hypothetical protein
MTFALLPAGATVFLDANTFLYRKLLLGRISPDGLIVSGSEAHIPSTPGSSFMAARHLAA